jgi:Ca2+-binding EF-hand superfamily protein
MDLLNNKELNNDYYSRILYKFKKSGLKVASLISKCEKVDRNKDGIIHFDDLEDIIQDCLGINRLNAREMTYLKEELNVDRKKGTIRYISIQELFDIESSNQETEIWKSDKLDNDDNGNNRVISKGSVGEFLQKSACPAEIKNLQKFLSLVEKYEKNTGLAAATSDDGFILPLGPNLRVSVQFFME